jgi:N-methylhydantoinase A
MENVAKDDISIAYELDLRYQGQEHTLSVAVSSPFSEADKITAAHAFDKLHFATYGHNAPEEPKVMVSLKAIGIGRVKKPTLKTIPTGNKTPPDRARTGHRPVYRGNNVYEEFIVWRRERLLAGNVIQGPALVEETTSTSVIESDQSCKVDPYGNLIITYKPGRMQ